MTQIFLVDSTGAYLGSFDGPGGGYWNGTEWTNPPAGAITVPTPPPSGDSTWVSNAWVPGPMALVAQAQAMVAAALQAGLTIESTATPALNATYALDTTTLDQIKGLKDDVKQSLGLPFTPFYYPDINGTNRGPFAENDVVNLYVAMRNYATALDQAAAGQASWPVASKTIA